MLLSCTYEASPEAGNLTAQAVMAFKCSVFNGKVCVHLILW